MDQSLTAQIFTFGLITRGQNVREIYFIQSLEVANPLCDFDTSQVMGIILSTKFQRINYKPYYM